ADDAHRPRRIGLRPSDPRHGRERGSARCQMQKLPSARKFHRGPSLLLAYSITSSARASSVGGTSMPSALAVLRLTANSNLIGCSIGRSLGLAPRKILAT